MTPDMSQKKHPINEDQEVEAEPLPRLGILGKFDYSVLHQPQEPDSGMNALFGKWPGDESDEEILALLEEMS
jgi:hypothetical protein